MEKKQYKKNGIMINDGNLISKYLDGDTNAFDMLYEKYKRQLYSYLRRILSGNDSFCDDIFQQTWLKAIENFKSYKENERFLAWIMRISHNLAMDHFRKHSREFIEDTSSPELFASIANNQTPSRELSIKEIRESLDKCLEMLPLEQKEVFILRADNIPFKDISDIQKCSINTTLARMQYALKSLRNCLKNRRG